MREVRLAPADVMEIYQCSRRVAWRIMREAGGFRLGQSIRVTQEQLKQWEEKQTLQGSTSVAGIGGSPVIQSAAKQYPRDAPIFKPRVRSVRSEKESLQIRPTQPRTRPRLENSLHGLSS